MEAAAAQACHLPLAQHVRMLVLGNCPSTLRGYPTVHRLTSEPVVVVVMEAVVEAAAAVVAALNLDNLPPTLRGCPTVPRLTPGPVVVVMVEAVVEAAAVAVEVLEVQSKTSTPKDDQIMEGCGRPQHQRGKCLQNESS